MLFATDKTKEDFSVKLDKYGDSYMEDSTDESLKEVYYDIFLLKKSNRIKVMANSSFFFLVFVYRFGMTYQAIYEKLMWTIYDKGTSAMMDSLVCSFMV